MTRTPPFPELALLTLRDPHAAAQIILGWNLPKEAIWTAIALVSVLLTILSTLSNMLAPIDDPMLSVISTPFVYFAIAAGGFVATVYAIYWTGRLLGGRGRIEDLMVLLLWLQALWAAAQAVLFVFVLVSPVLASFFLALVAVSTIWIFVHFISIGLQFNSLVKAIVVLILGTLALIVGTSLVLSVIGVSTTGVIPSV